MAGPDAPKEQALPAHAPRETLRTLPIIGHFTAPEGLGQYEDGHGNTLSSKTLHCAGEEAPRSLPASEAKQLHERVMQAAFTASLASSFGLDPGETVTMTPETAKNDPRIAQLEARGKRRVTIDTAAKVIGDMVSGQYDLGTLESPLHAACAVPPPASSKAPHR